MIICSCNAFSKKRIVEVAKELAESEPDRAVTPARIFKKLGGRPQCGTCFQMIRQDVAAAGILVTCPEPLASVAEGEEIGIL